MLNTNHQASDNQSQDAMRYFKVTVERGHCGSGKAIATAFYFAAETALQALKKAQRMPSVKHHKIPLSVVEITQEEYHQGREISAYQKEGQQLEKNK